MITQDQVRSLFEYMDGGLYWRVSPANSVLVGARAGTPSGAGYRQVCIDGNSYLEHRLIYLLHHGYLPKFLDHINGVRNDNRVENLRPCNRQQNGYNAKAPCNNTSGTKGVSWYKSVNKWVAQINVGGKPLYLGCFGAIEDARAAVVSARTKYHGEFANP